MTAIFNATRLQNKIVLITGASGGMSGSHCCSCKSESWSPFLTHKNALGIGAVSLRCCSLLFNISIIINTALGCRDPLCPRMYHLNSRTSGVELINLRLILPPSLTITGSVSRLDLMSSLQPGESTRWSKLLKRAKLRTKNPTSKLVSAGSLLPLLSMSRIGQQSGNFGKRCRTIWDPLMFWVSSTQELSNAISLIFTELLEPSEQRWIRFGSRKNRKHIRNWYRRYVCNERVRSHEYDSVINQRCSLAHYSAQFDNNSLSWKDFKGRNAGHVINIGSIAGREPYAGGAIYCATKHAISAFNGSLLRELVDTPIRVTEIQPGKSKSSQLPQ